MHDEWRGAQVPNDWQEVVLVPIPTKSDLTVCDNWRGICLLEAVEKVGV